MKLSPADRDDRLPALGSLAVFWSLACASPATGLSMHLSVLLSFLFFSCSDRSDQGGKNQAHAGGGGRLGFKRTLIVGNP